jgi:phage gp36-like protein
LAYLTKQDLVDELGEDKLAKLTDDGESDEVIINDTRVAAVIENAKGVFESYIRGRYSLPVKTTPLVKQLNKKLAIFELYENRATVDEGVYKIRRNAYDSAIATLKDIAAGRAALDVPAAEETTTNPATPDRILTNAGKTKFTDDALKSF